MTIENGGEHQRIVQGIHRIPCQCGLDRRLQPERRRRVCQHNLRFKDLVWQFSGWVHHAASLVEMYPVLTIWLGF